MDKLTKLLISIAIFSITMLAIFTYEVIGDEPLQIDCDIVYSNRFEFPDYVYASCLNKDDNLCFEVGVEKMGLSEAIQLDYQDNDKVSILRITQSYQPTACN